jgi:hypothetical protein
MEAPSLIFASLMEAPSLHSAQDCIQIKILPLPILASLDLETAAGPNSSLSMLSTDFQRRKTPILQKELTRI